MHRLVDICPYKRLAGAAPVRSLLQYGRIHPRLSWPMAAPCRKPKCWQRSAGQVAPVTATLDRPSTPHQACGIPSHSLSRTRWAVLGRAAHGDCQRITDDRLRHHRDTGMLMSAGGWADLTLGQVLSSRPRAG